jgi:hypothetical protein
MPMYKCIWLEATSNWRNESQLCMVSYISFTYKL